MTDETLYDQAWDHWRRTLTDALAPAAGNVSPPVFRALADAGAFDAADGCITRDWALGLMTRESDHVRRLAARGLSDGEVSHLVDLIHRHPPPAAGG